MSYDYLFKLILVGDNAVGKTSLVDMLIQKNFHCHYNPTIGVEFASRTVVMPDGKMVKTHLWDTAGQECFAPIIKSYYRGTAGIIIVFDLSSPRSFKRVNYWLKEIRDNRDDEPAAMILVGNKSDRHDRRITREEAEKLAEQEGLLYGETSARRGDNIDAVFHRLVKNIYENMSPGDEPGPGIRLHFAKGKGEKKKERDCRTGKYDCCCIC